MGFEVIKQEPSTDTQQSLESEKLNNFSKITERQSL